MRLLVLFSLFLIHACGAPSDGEGELASVGSSLLNPTNHHAEFPSGVSVKRSQGPIASRCANFLDDAGNPGPWGQELIAAMQSHGETFYDYNNDYGFVQLWEKCPGFANRGQDFINNAWIWTFMGLAMMESTCNENITAPGTNSTAYGLFQMPSGDSWRGSECSGNIRSAANNIRCAVRVMNDHILGTEYDPGSIRNNGSYWAPVRDGSLANWVSQHPACNVAASDLAH